MIKILYAIGITVFVNLISFYVSSLIPIYDKIVDVQGIGSAVCGFSGTVLGILITVITLVVTLKGVHIEQYKQYGYFNFLIVFYLLVFIELGITFICGFLSFIKDIDLPILYLLISLSLSCFILLFLMLVSCIGMALRNN